MATKYPDRKAFKTVCETLEQKVPLRFDHIGDVFGPDFWMMLVESLLDAQDAARAIQGAVNRLKAGEHVPQNEATN